MRAKYDVIVLGAGLAGLACTDELLRSKKKLKVLLLEKNNYPGGLAATFKDNDFLFDMSPHRWLTKNSELDIWLSELLGKELISVKKNTPMYQFGQYYAYPVRILDVLKKVGLFNSFLMLTSYIYARVVNKIMSKKIVTLEDAYINRFGWFLYQWFNLEYNEKLWGKGGCRKMSADFVDQRVKNLSMVSAIKNAIGMNKNKVISLIDSFNYPKKGIGRISDRLDERIIEHGGTINLNTKINRIEKNDAYTVYTDNGTFQTNEIISSIPLDELIDSLRCPKKIRISARKLNYIDQRIVILLINKIKLTDYTWVYVHPKKIRFFRFLETNNWSKSMSPKNKTSLVFEYPYQKNDRIDKLTDGQLIKLTIDDLRCYFTPELKNGDILKTIIYRVDKAYPKYDLQYSGQVKRIKTYLKENHQGLQIIGRNGMFRYNNMDHSVYTGILAARNIIEGKIKYNLDLVNNEAEYLEEKRI